MNKLIKYFKDDIVRRVFVKNTFDGVITILGILIALFFAGINQSNIVILSCLGSGIAIGVSGIFGAYITESAERQLKIKTLEKHLLKSLKNTKLSKISGEYSIVVALFDGLSPLLATLLMLIPFFLGVNTTIAFYISFIIALGLIIFLGVFISSIGKEKFLPNILKMIGAGVALTIILYLIEVSKIIQ